MSDEEHGAEGAQLQFHVPAVPLHGVNINIGPRPDGQPGKAMLIGPLMFALPLDEDAAAEIASSLQEASVVLAPADAIRRLPAMAIPGGRR